MFGESVGSGISGDCGSGDSGESYDSGVSGDSGESRDSGGSGDSGDLCDSGISGDSGVG